MNGRVSVAALRGNGNIFTLTFYYLQVDNRLSIQNHCYCDLTPVSYLISILFQIEDKAMEELLVFYNAANTFDERITVKRILCANIAKPLWIKSRHQ